LDTEAGALHVDGSTTNDAAVRNGENTSRIIARATRDDRRRVIRRAGKTESKVKTSSTISTEIISLSIIAIGTPESEVYFLLRSKDSGEHIGIGDTGGIHHFHALAESDLYVGLRSEVLVLGNSVGSAEIDEIGEARGEAEGARDQVGRIAVGVKIEGTDQVCVTNLDQVLAISVKENMALEGTIWNPSAQKRVCCHERSFRISIHGVGNVVVQRIFQEVAGGVKAARSAQIKTLGTGDVEIDRSSVGAYCKCHQGCEYKEISHSCTALDLD